MKKTSPHSRIALIAFTCLVDSAIFICPSEVRSQSASESLSAGEYAKQAQIAYDLQDWPAAIREYQAAYRAEQKPEYLWGIAQAQRLSGDCTKAISTYKAYRRAEITANQATAAELQVMKCEAEILKQEAAAGKPASKSDVAPAAQVPAAAAPTQAARPVAGVQRNQESQKPFYKDALGDTLLLTGILATGIGTYFLLKGNSDMSKSNRASVYQDYDSRATHASREQIAGVATLGGGGLLLTSAVLRYLTLGGGARGEHAALIVAPSHIAWCGRF